MGNKKIIYGLVIFVLIVTTLFGNYLYQQQASMFEWKFASSELNEGGK